MRQQALAALFLHDRETPVANLVYDSLLDEPAETQSAERTLRFVAADGGMLTVRATPCAAGLEMTVHIEPPGRYAVTVNRKSARPLLIDTDPAGRARIPGVRAGLMSLRFVPDDGTSCDARRTAWVVY